MVDVAGLTCDTRSTAIELFDQFMAVSLNENCNIFSNCSYVSLASTVAVLLSSKIHEVRPIPMARFAHFSTEDIVEFEVHFLLKIEFKTAPQNTPINFVRHALHVWLTSNPNFSLTNANHLYMLAGDLVAEFLELHDSLYFAPSTIGITALLASFSKFRLDCKELCSNLSILDMHQKLRPEHEYLYNQTDMPLFDMHSCFQLMEVLPSMQYIAEADATVCQDVEVSGCCGQVDESTCEIDRNTSSPVGVSEMTVLNSITESAQKAVKSSHLCCT